MTNATFDENHTPTLTAVSSADGRTIKRALADPTTHALYTVNTSSGTDNGNNNGNAMLDENHVPVMLAVSAVNATVNGVTYIQYVTPVEVYADQTTGAIFTTTNP